MSRMSKTEESWIQGNCLQIKVWLLFGLSSALFLGSLIWQYIIGDLPCTLCLVQRYLLLAISILWLYALMRSSSCTSKTLSLLGLVLLFVTMGTSLWQWQLQSMPSEGILDGVCTPQSELLSHNHFWGGLFTGSGSCHEVKAQLFGVNMTAWIVLVLGIMLVINSWLLWCAFKSRPHKGRPQEDGTGNKHDSK